MNIATYSKYERYINSGVDWLGDIPADWEVKKFKFLASVKKGKVPTQIITVNHCEFPPYLSMEYLRGGEANQFVADRNVALVDDDHILLLWDGSNAGEFVRARKGVVSSTLASVHFYSLYKEFAWYACHITEMELRNTTVGMGIPHVDGEQLNNSRLAVPSFGEQKTIASFLKEKCAKIDEAVRIKEEQIKLLRERRQILIQQAVTRGLNPDAPMKDSGIDWIGQIPTHWEVRKVKQIFRLVADAAEKNNAHELLSIYTEIGVRPRKDLEERGNKASTTDGYWMVRKGDFIVNKLLAWMGAIGVSEYDGVTSPAYDILRPRVSLNGNFFHRLFRSQSFSSEIKRFSRGIMEMRLRIYFDKLGVLLVPFPPKIEQDEIISFLDKHEQKIERTIAIKENQITTLKEYKTTLINAAVTGKIKITEDRR